MLKYKKQLAVFALVIGFFIPSISFGAPVQATATVVAGDIVQTSVNPIGPVSGWNNIISWNAFEISTGTIYNSDAQVADAPKTLPVTSGFVYGGAPSGDYVYYGCNMVPITCADSEGSFDSGSYAVMQTRASYSIFFSWNASTEEVTVGPPAPVDGVTFSYPTEGATVPATTPIQINYTNQDNIYTHVQMDITDDTTSYMNYQYYRIFDYIDEDDTINYTFTPGHDYTMRMRLVEIPIGGSVEATTDWTEYISFTAVGVLIGPDPLEDLDCSPYIIDIPLTDNDIAIPAFGCEIKNALKWAFVPTPASLTQFSNLSVSDKAPFVYLYQLPTVVGYLWDSPETSPLVMTSMAFPGAGSLTFFSRDVLLDIPFIATIRGFIQIAMYVMTVIVLYNLAKKFH